MGTKNSKYVGSQGELYRRNDLKTVWGTPLTTGDLMNFNGSSSTVGYDGWSDHTLYPPSFIPEDKCEIKNANATDTCMKSRPLRKGRKYYQGCLCNNTICPDGYDWDTTQKTCINHVDPTPSSTPSTTPSTPSSSPFAASAASDWNGDASSWSATAIGKEDCQGYASQGVLVPIEGTPESTKLMWNDAQSVCQTVYSNVNGCGVVGLKYPTNFNGAYLDCVPLDKAQLERGAYAAQVEASKGPTIPNTVSTSPVPVPTSSGSGKPPAKPAKPDDPPAKPTPTPKGLPKGAKIGIGVGAGLLLLIILFLIMNPPKK